MVRMTRLFVRNEEEEEEEEEGDFLYKLLMERIIVFLTSPEKRLKEH